MSGGPVFRKSTFCSGSHCVEVAFIRPSFCADGQCVEVANGQGEVLVRDRTGHTLPFEPSVWTDFLNGIQAGEFV